MKRIILFIYLALILTALSNAALGQSATASLRGVVTDATNAVVPGAEVVITLIGTAQQRVQQTDNDW